MEESTSREKVLKKIRKALIQRGDNSYLNADLDKEVFAVLDESPEIVFATKLTELKGNFIFCIDEEDLSTQLRDLFESKNWLEAFYKEEEIFYFLQKAGIAHTETIKENQPVIAVSLCEFCSAYRFIFCFGKTKYRKKIFREQ